MSRRSFAGPLLVAVALCLLPVVNARSGAVAASVGSSASVQRVLNVVILGDSYSAGNGAWREHGKPDSRVYFGPVPCMRSPFNWGRRYRKVLRSALGMKVTYVNHACSGGVVADITEPRRMEELWRLAPMPSPPIESDEVNDYANEHGLCGHLSNYADEQYVVAEDGRVDDVAPEILFACRRYLRPQQDFVGPQTDLVLLTMGGNDIQFSDIVTQCFVPVVRDRDTCVGRTVSRLRPWRVADLGRAGA